MHVFKFLLFQVSDGQTAGISLAGCSDTSDIAEMCSYSATKANLEENGEKHAVKLCNYPLS